jgi:hypothetical protein
VLESSNWLNLPLLWVAFLPPISRKAVTNGSLGGEGALIFQKVDGRELGRYGIKAVSKNEIEDIAGYSRQQLHDLDKP